MGEPGNGDRRCLFPDPARQSFPGHAGAVSSAAENPRGGGNTARSRRHQGTGERQARARNRGGRRPQPAFGRAAGRRKIDAGGTAALDPAAADAGGIAGSLDGRLGRRRNRGRLAHQQAAVSKPASFSVHAGFGRRRPARAAGRSVARTSRRAVPRRVCRIPEVRRSTRYASRSRPARSRSRAPITASLIRRASCWWRR